MKYDVSEDMARLLILLVLGITLMLITITGNGLWLIPGLIAIGVLGIIFLPKDNP